MRYIYYIGVPTGKIDLSAPGGNYIGQGTDDDFSRMLEHLQIAYGNHNGPVKGSEELIRRVGASDVFFGVYYASQNYGLDKQLFTDMAAAGGDLSTPEAQLDAAEIMHIISHNGDLSGGNIATGGQGALVGRSNSARGVYLFNQYYPNARQQYAGNLNEVKVLGTDSRDVAIKKLCNPDDYMVFRAASLALEQEILYNAAFLSQLTLLYIDPTTRGSVSNMISQKVQSVVATLNNNIFQVNRIKAHNINSLIQLVENKFLKGIDARIKIISINSLLNSLIQNKFTIVSYIVNGVPGFQRNTTNPNHVVYQTTLHIRRSELISTIPNYQPQGYINLMNSPTPPPKNNSRESDAIHRYVEACVYSIFKSHYKKCTDATQPPAPVILSNGQPAILRPPEPTLRQKMADIYKKYRPMTYFFSFYSYAISILQRENGRGLSQLLPNSNGFGQPEFGDYTFEPAISASTGFYSGSEDTVDQIMALMHVNEIPSGTG